MKCISKNTEPVSFTNWKKNNPNATYDNLAGETKKDLRKALLKEQHSICCYCECRINNEDRNGLNSFHIEHFKPKGNNLFPDLQLEYSNLHASCRINKSNDPNIHCGHKKNDEYSDDLISPLEKDCSLHFGYNLDGTITCDNEDNRAKETIRILNLNSSLLIADRKNLIDDFLDIDDENIKEEIDNHLDESLQEYGEFFTMIEYLNKNNLL